MNEIKENYNDLHSQLIECEFFVSDEMASRLLKLSSNDFKFILDGAYYYLELTASRVLIYKTEEHFKKMDDMLGRLDDLKHIMRIIKDHENACKHENYQEYMEDENGEMIYSCQACEGTFYRFDED